MPETRVQAAAGLKEPDPVVTDHVTVPVGVSDVPESVSLTVAVHVEPALTGSLAGTHPALVDVVRVVAVTLAVPELVLWSASPPYAALGVCPPTLPAAGVYDTEQLPDDSTQLVGLNVPLPALSDQVTVPPGVAVVPVSLSVTIAVHVVAALTGVEVGVQLAAVLVARVVAVTVVVAELGECVESPP